MLVPCANWRWTAREVRRLALAASPTNQQRPWMRDVFVDPPLYLPRGQVMCAKGTRHQGLGMCQFVSVSVWFGGSCHPRSGRGAGAAWKLLPMTSSQKLCGEKWILNSRVPALAIAYHPSLTCSALGSRSCVCIILSSDSVLINTTEGVHSVLSLPTYLPYLPLVTAYAVPTVRISYDSRYGDLISNYTPSKYN